ncbi:MAG: VCBS repeat-containing protein, partial [Candidatus Solibacter usitatus]|nr:VCBS repeat-containing protein [Candidatus Solibacter usitatus]
MKSSVPFLALLAVSAADAPQDRLWHHRNLGKAFYENPTTQVQAVEEFKKALDLAPTSARERLNYGLALLRAGKTKEGIAEVEKAQKQDPKVPHTWFNLGIAFKKEGEYDKAVQQLERMIQLVPDEPISHYNLAVLYKLNGKMDVALKHFETATRLDPNLAGPHFQLYNAYRQAGRGADARRELDIFQEIKKRTAGAAVPEDMEWSYYAEIYETIDPRPAPQPAAELKFKDSLLPRRATGLVILDLLGNGRAQVLTWSADGASAPGLEQVKGIASIAPGDFNNDGLPDLCVLTESGASLWINQKGKFQKHPAQLPEGRFEKAVWIDYDHDYDLDLVLLGAKSALVRNNGAAGFSDQTASFPFAKAHASDGAIFKLIADTPGVDLVVAYEDRPAVLYRDKLAGKYEAQPLDVIPSDTDFVVAYDIDNDGWMDLAAAGPRGTVVALNRSGKLIQALALERARGPLLFADLENRGLGDLIAGGVVYRNQGMGRLPQVRSPLSAASAAAEGDLDGDGRTDLALVSSDGAVHVLTNQTATRNTWLRAGLSGVKNLKLADSAEVEVKAGAHYQKKIYQGLPLLFGLPAGTKEVDTVRITWPNGLIQNEPKQLAGKAFVYKEAQRLSGSCPMIFTWNGKEFEFITDVLGVAPLGASSGDG